MNWRRGEGGWGGEQEPDNKGLVSPSRKFKLYPGTGEESQVGWGRHTRERVWRLTLLDLQGRQLTFTAEWGMGWKRESLGDRDRG